MTESHREILHLGEEHDQQLRDVLMQVLEELGARQLRNEWGLGGSQVIETLEVQIEGERLVVEAETYMGLSITGSPPLVDRVRDLVLERYKQLGLKIFLSPS